MSEHDDPDEDQDWPLTVVVSGPGGVGKGTVVERLVETVPDLWLSRSWTTRDPRPGEAPDAYNFVTREEFEAHVTAGGFLEWVQFLDYLQGSPIPEPPPGHAVILEIDVQGAAQVKAMNHDAVLVFVDAPTPQEQQRRLRARGDTEEQVERRMTHGASERTAAAALGCTVVINDNVETAVAALAEIVKTHR